MGMFNTIFAEIACPQGKGEKTTTQSIQIKWQVPEARCLDGYRIGDALPQLMPGFDDTWIKTDYICQSCSAKTVGKRGREYIRTMDQQWHVAFVEVRAGRLCRILSELEVADAEVADYQDDTWPRKTSSNGRTGCGKLA